jgi:hypothetical protein
MPEQGIHLLLAGFLCDALKFPMQPAKRLGNRKRLRARLVADIPPKKRGGSEIADPLVWIDAGHIGPNKHIVGTQTNA